MSGLPKDHEDLWAQHEGMARSIVQRYHMRFPTVLDFDEKLTHACMAMMQCMKLWDPEKGAKFSTYMYSAIRREVGRAIAIERTHISPGPINDPGKYGISFNRTDFQEGEDEEGNPHSLHAELYAANRVERQQVEEVIDFKHKTEMIDAVFGKNVLRASKKMRPKYKKAYKLIMEEAYTYSEAARESGLSHESIRSMMMDSVQEMTEYYDSAERTNDGR